MSGTAIGAPLLTCSMSAGALEATHGPATGGDLPRAEVDDASTNRHRAGALLASWECGLELITDATERQLASNRIPSLKTERI